MESINDWILDTQSRRIMHRLELFMPWNNFDRLFILVSQFERLFFSPDMWHTRATTLACVLIMAQLLGLVI